jgi:Pyruvate/2-oxoacid:ferredoxin oxidoreductase delta subunit
VKFPPEPPWLTAKIDQRISVIRAGGAFDIASEQQPIIATFLDEGDHEMTEKERVKWERTCDNCGRYCPDGGMAFYTGHAGRIVNGRQVLLAYGVCDDCRLASTPTEKGTKDE